MMSNKVTSIPLTGGGISLNNRVLGLDIMRVLLAFLIFLFHSRMHFACDYSILNSFVKMGAIAMTGFFMLSGYSLHLSSSKKDLTNIKEIKKFYIKRLITVLPLYYAIALIHVVWSLVCGKISLTEVAVLFPVEITATQSTFTTLFHNSHNSGTWFISCIIICYFVYPFLQSLLLQLSNKTKVIILLLICGLLFYAPIVQHYFHLDDVQIYTSPFYRMIEFTVGIIVAQINTGKENKLLTLLRSPYSLAFSMVVLVLGVSFGLKAGLPGDYMLFNVIAVPCFIVMLFSFGHIKFHFIKDGRVLLYLSGISFTFFLCQVLPLWDVSRYVYNLISYDSNLLRIIISLTMCFMGAVAIHHIVETPVGTFLKKKLI